MRPSARDERKTVRGLHRSVVDGRLWRQLELLRRRAPFRYLLVEGPSINEGPLAAEAVRGLLVAIDDLGVAVVRSNDVAESASWIGRIAQRPKRDPHVSPPGRALAAAAGVSTVTARNLLDEFGSLISVLLASPQQLRQVRGVGANRANAIHQLAQSN